MEVKITIRLGHFTCTRQGNFKIQGPKPEKAEAVIQTKIHICTDEDC